MLRELEIQGFHHKSGNLSGLLMWIDVAIKNYEQIRGRRDLEQSLLVLGLALEARDLETAGHTQRVVKMADLMGRAFGLNRRQQSALRQGAYLHDLGKLSIPDEILLKPGKLDPAQWEVMKRHAALGYELAAGIPNIKPEALDVIRHHHERWDGTGYPIGLHQEEIPLLARIFAICDVFDALVSPRIYKPPWVELEAIRELSQQRNKQFDPEVVDAFMQLWSEHAFDDPTLPIAEFKPLLEEPPVLVMPPNIPHAYHEVGMAQRQLGQPSLVVG
jgi:HD-GYP domain-containing protein (c-di-GMP phosphodiesterase class II)